MQTRLNLVFFALLLMTLLLALSGCGSNADGISYAAPASPVTTLPTAYERAITAIVSEENAYRTLKGKAPITRGMKCVLSSITGGDRIQASIPGHQTLQGIKHLATFIMMDAFDQPNAPVGQGLSILPVPFRTLTNNYALGCTGQIVITDDDWYSFQLSSDDAGLLYIDGKKVIDVDNAHAVTTGTVQILLRKGVHSIKVAYAQTGAGMEALILNVNGDIVSPISLYH